MTSEEQVTEDKLRKWAASQSYRLEKSGVQNKHLPDFGRYGLSAEHAPLSEIGFYIRRDGKYWHSLTLEQVRWLLALGLRELRHICPNDANDPDFPKGCLRKLIERGMPVSEEEKVLFGLEDE